MAAEPCGTMSGPLPQVIEKTCGTICGTTCGTCGTDAAKCLNIRAEACGTICGTTPPYPPMVPQARRAAGGGPRSASQLKATR